MSKKVFSRLAKKYSDPIKVQNFIDTLKYNKEKDGETLASAIKTFNKKSAHCFEAAFLAAAILEHKGYPPLILSIESIDNLDHVVFVYKKNSKWGTVGQSRDKGLRGRRPIYRSLRALVYSYFDPYIDLTGCISAYQIAHLDDTKTNWRFSKRNLWKAEKFLIDLKHKKIRYSKKRYKKHHKNYLKGKRLKKRNGWL